MRTIFLGLALISVSSIAQAQAPSAKLPGPAELPSGSSISATPNAGNDEVSARRKLEEQGYRDLRNMAPNADGTFSGKAVRETPPGTRRPGIGPEVNVEIDASGNVKER